MNKLNVAHIFCSTLHSEPRLLKSILSVKDKIDHVYVIGIYSSNHGVNLGENVNHSIHKFRTMLASFPIIRYKAFVRYSFWYTRVFFFFLFKKLDLIHAHSIEDLPIARILCKFKNAKLIYEPHELETERVGWFGFNKKLAKRVEKKLIYKVDKINVVSPTIQDWYSKNYDLNKEKIKIIRNIPIMDQLDQDEKRPNNSLRKKFRIPESSILFIYQGAIQNTRGIDILLESFSNLTEKHQIVFLGDGNKKESVIRYSERHKNIHLHEKVDYSELIYFTQKADIGIHMIENKCLNNYYCLPNKIFEYLYSNIAVLTSNFPDMEEIIKEYDAGWTCAPKKEDLINLIRTINKDDVIKKTQYSFNEKWENDYLDQINYYSKLIQK